MRPLVTLPCLLPLVFAACVAGDPDPVSPDEQKPAAVHASALNGSGATRAYAARPISGHCALTTLATVPYPSPPVFRQTVTGECQLAHLGQVSVWFVQVVDFATRTQASLELTYTAANGDVLRAASAGTNAPTATGVSFSATITFLGGTGRFENATGRGQAEGTANIATGTSQYGLDGWIEYDASDRAKP